MAPANRKNRWMDGKMMMGLGEAEAHKSTKDSWSSLNSPKKKEGLVCDYERAWFFLFLGCFFSFKRYITFPLSSLTCGEEALRGTRDGGWRMSASFVFALAQWDSVKQGGNKRREGTEVRITTSLQSQTHSEITEKKMHKELDYIIIWYCITLFITGHGGRTRNH